jgi:hypothetical protein
LLTAVRVGHKHKKIQIQIPKLDDFIHKTYVNVSRKVYSNVYLFQNNLPSLEIQKNMRELELLVQDCILHTVRESIPVEAILRAYLDETVEEEIEEQIVEETKPEVTFQDPKESPSTSAFHETEPLVTSGLTALPTPSTVTSTNPFSPSLPTPLPSLSASPPELVEVGVEELGGKSKGISFSDNVDIQPIESPFENLVITDEVSDIPLEIETLDDPLSLLGDIEVLQLH